MQWLYYNTTVKSCAANHDLHEDKMLQTIQYKFKNRLIHVLKNLENDI
jgi:hypothetical protein